MGRSKRIVWQPRDLAEAWNLGSLYGKEACYVSGGTWLRPHWEAGRVPVPRHFIRLDLISRMYGIVAEQRSGRGGLRIGGMTSVAVCLKETRLRETVPSVAEACRRIGSPAVRHFATIGGNVVTAGDAVPALLSAGARLEWFDGRETVEESLEDWVQRRRERQDPREERILVSVFIPFAVGAERCFHFYLKLGRREAFVPSLVTVAGKVRLDEAGAVCEISLAAGGSTAIPVRLRRTEQLLLGRTLSAPVLERAYDAVKEEFIPGPDPFASESYRRTAAANLIAAELLRALEQWKSGGGCCATGS